MEAQTTTTDSAITIRRMDLSNDDRDAVAELADRDSRDHLNGPVLGLEVEGRLLAAISLSSGAEVSDPFAPTDELRSVLELRAGQLRKRFGGSRERKRSRPAVGGSPAGSIIKLPRWG